MRHLSPSGRRLRAVPKLLTALLVAFGIGATSGATAQDLPALGGDIGGGLTATEEVRIGQQFLEQARKHLEFVEDPEVLEYVRSVGYRITAQANFRAYPFHFYVVKDSSLNAFAVPGGHIFLHSGLVEEADSAAELAGVLAHEVAHITQRHMARQVSAGRKTQTSTLLLVAAGILAGISGQGEAAQGLITGAGAYGQQRMLAFSRTYEREADRLGLQYLARAGFDPQGLVDFLEKLQRWSDLQGRAPPPFLSTHPMTGNRIADVQNRASELRQEGNTPLGEDTFRRVQVRLEATTSSSPAKTYQRFQEQLSEDPGNEALRYGLALSARRTGRTEEAVSRMESLVADFPETVTYRSALAELYLDAGRTQEAVSEYRAALERHPGSADLREHLGQALLAQGEAEEARKVLLDVTRDYPKRPSAHRALAQAYARLDLPIQAHRTEAEARWLEGERAAAVEQLELAQRLAKEKSSPQLGQIQARLKEIRP